ncbi:major facilitator superfamily domain-containing protein [Lactarius sanguifluus]|nr:major facilitator superfamily domain-containing protein [Lactarius sanguifluus]
MKDSLDVIAVEYDVGDKRDPINFSRERKWVMTLVACLFTGVSAAAASSYSFGIPSMTRDLNCTDFQATIAFSVFPLGFALTPLFTAPFSEEFGRRPLYLVSGVGFLAMHILLASAKHINTVIIARLLGGAFGSTWRDDGGGDYCLTYGSQNSAGFPCRYLQLSAIGGTGLGPVGSAWIEANSHLQWRWIQWFQAIIAKDLRKRTGNEQYMARIELERPSLKSLLIVSCTRPLYFLLWVGFAWGVFYCMIENVHNFNIGETGTVFVAANVVPEARLTWARFAGIMFPVGMFVYAWTSFSRVSWIAMTIGIVIFIWATFIIYLAAFTYLADCYGTYASSAIAAQSLSRNLLGMAFPLFTKQMFATLTYKWGNTLFGLYSSYDGSHSLGACTLTCILFYYGPAIRARSKISQRTMEAVII